MRDINLGTIAIAAFSVCFAFSVKTANATDSSYQHPFQIAGQYSTKCHYEYVKVLKWINGEKVIILEKKRVCILVLAVH